MKNLPKSKKAVMSKNKLVELMKFDNNGSAYIAKTRLESAGIHCMLAGEDSTGFQPILTSRTGGIRLLVLEPDFEHARAILAGEDPDPDWENLEEGEDDPEWF